jgi:hypothetical protein
MVRGGVVRVGEADPALTPMSGMVAIAELCRRLRLVGYLDAGIGPIKQRNRGCSGGELLAGLAQAQLAGEDFLVGLDRLRADSAGQQLVAVAGLASATAAGLADRFTGKHWTGVESGLSMVAGRALELLPLRRRCARWASS